MSKQEVKSNILPPLQKRIILHLAKSGAQTINETDKAVSGLEGHYKSSYTALKTLEEKKLVKQTEIKTYRTIEYPRYWLTQAGIFFALVEGADAQTLLERTTKTYPDDKTLQGIVEISPLTGLEGLRIALSAIQDKGKLDNSDMARILLAGAQRDVSIQQFKELFRILRKYPKDYERTKKHIGQVSALLAKLVSSF